LAAERELLAQRAEDLSALNVGTGEWQQLSIEQSRLAHAAGLIETASYGVQALADAEDSCEAQLRGVVTRLASMAQYDPALAETTALLESAQIQLQEAAHALRQYQQRLDLDPAELEAVEARLSAIHEVARKYRVRPEELTALREATDARLKELATTLDTEALAREEAAAHETYATLANELRTGRERAAATLSHKVTETMQSLALAGGEFEVALHPLDAPASYGTEQIEFLVSAHAGLPRRPLAKVASGGELSRLSLAVQVVTSEVAQVPTLIFDEVDVGIGGGVAEIVGRLLRALGDRRQVLCVTHLAQVAACAHQQYVVSKTDNGAGIRTTVHELGAGQRIEELARMLGGVRITDKTLAHAREMLAAHTNATASQPSQAIAR
jgi:DNA repair protein RecN (Recombination protein N)